MADTRGNGFTGAFGPPTMSGNSSRSFLIPAGNCSIPSSAQAHSLNITVVPPAPLTYLTAWPTGQSQPGVSTLNSYDGRIIANAAMVPAGTSGAISIYVSDTTDVVIDINGYFASPGTGGLAFYPVTPCQVADTSQYISGGSSRNFTVGGACGVPTSASAYSLNVTAKPVSSLFYLTLWPAGSTQPLVSTLSALDGANISNTALVPAGAGGQVSVFVSDASNAKIDVNGYFAPPGAGGEWFYTMTPCRVADTRGANGPLGGPNLVGGATQSFPIPSSSCNIPSSAQTYSFNLTVVPLASLAYLTAWPVGQSQPNTWNITSPLGKVVADAALVGGGSGGAINVSPSANTHFIIDVNGYFAPGTQNPTQTVATSPPGLLITVDGGAPCTSPCTFQWGAGTSHTIATTSPQAGPTGTRYTFSNWSDGGAISHSVVVPSSPITYTASFSTQCYF